MRILALETSQMAGSVAALDGPTIRVERELDPTQRSAQSLAPAMRDVLAEIGWQSRDVELVATTVGSGSFTGLRVGVATAKAFAYAAGCQTLGVNTLEAIAARLPAEYDRFYAVIDAQRHQVFFGRFVRGGDGAPTWAVTTTLANNADFFALLAPGDVVTGPGLMKLAASVPPQVTLAPSDLWAPMALAVGKVAMCKFAAGARETVFELAPQYFRQTAAEEQWARRNDAKA